MPIKALIFDYDGVLVESETNSFKLLKSILKKRHAIAIPQELFAKKIGRSSQTFLIEYFSDRLSSAEIDGTYQEYLKTFQAGIAKYSTVHKQVIATIRKAAKTHKIAIASMSPRLRIETMLGVLGIEDLIASLIAIEDVAHHKPDPEVYIKTLANLDISADEAVVIEDTAVGAQAGIAAGIKVIGLVNGVSSVDDFAGVAVAQITTLDNFETDFLLIASY